MINGLIITVPSHELCDHLLERAEVHAGKAKKYAEEMAHLAEREIREDVNMTDDPVRRFREKRDEHHAKAEHFRFMGEHVIRDEEYRLSEADLLKVEFMRRWL